MEIVVDNILDSTVSEEKINPDIKNVDIVWHPLCEGEVSIKSESVPEDGLETKYLESVETQVYVKTENSSFVKAESMNEDLSDWNGSWGTGQGVIEVEDSYEPKHFNALGNLKTDEQLVTFSSDLNDISIRSRKAKHVKNIDFAQCYKTDETTSWEKEKEKIEVIRAPIIPIEPHEYITLTKDKYVCNHCQKVFMKLANLKLHIKKVHRKIATMYKCPYCPYMSKGSLHYHIIRKHKDAKDIQWFQCNFCESKFKLKYHLTQHMKVHFKHRQKQDKLNVQEKRYWCDKCDYKTNQRYMLKRHELTHMKPEERQYFYCYHCSYKSNKKEELKQHIVRHFRNENILFHCYICDFMTLKRDLIFEHFKKHSEHHSKLDETEYKYQLETLKKRDKRYCCDTCDYKTFRRQYLNNHKLVHQKPKQTQYFHCYHCSYKSIRKGTLKNHVSVHFEHEDVPFHCYLCDFMTPKRDLIIEHLKQHPKHHSTLDEIKYRYQLETSKKREKRYSCDKCDYKTYNYHNLKSHKIIHLKPEEIQYLHCCHCSYKCPRKNQLKRHILKHRSKCDETKYRISH